MRQLRLLGTMLFCVLLSFGLQSCSDEDSYGDGQVPESVRSAFASKYGDASSVAWSVEKGKYFVADFRLGVEECEAWYGADGHWYMTNFNYHSDLDRLPAVIRTVLKASRYGDWEIDGIRRFERVGFGVVFLVEVEKDGFPDMYLYFTADGLLFKSVEDADDDEWPSDLLVGDLPEKLLAFLSEHFSGYSVLEFEVDDDGIECTVIIGSKVYELYFDINFKFIYELQDIPVSRLPEAVVSAIYDRYPGAVIEECAIASKLFQGICYIVEIEYMGDDLELKVTPDGDIVVLDD